MARSWVALTLFSALIYSLPFAWENALDGI